LKKAEYGGNRTEILLEFLSGRTKRWYRHAQADDNFLGAKTQLMSEKEELFLALPKNP
jgi:hypothetical protein